MAASSMSIEEFAAHTAQQLRGTDTVLELFNRHFSPGNSESAIKLLTACSFMAEEAISEEMLVAGLGIVHQGILICRFVFIGGQLTITLPGPPESLPELLEKNVVIASLVGHDHEMRMNSTISIFVRDQLSDKEKQLSIEQALLIVAAYAHQPNNRDHSDAIDAINREHRIYPHLAKCLQHAEKLGPKFFRSARRVLLEDWSIFGVICDEEGDYQNAEKLFRLALGSLRDRAKAVIAKVNIAKAAIAEAAIAKAADLIAQLIATGQRVGSCCLTQMHHKDAERVYEQIIETFSIPEDVENVDPAALEILASMLTFLDQADEARVLYAKVLTKAERSPGPNSSKALDLVQALATNCYNSGLYEESEPLFQRVLISLEQQVGLLNPRTVKVRRALADAIKAQGRYGEAEEHLRISLKANEARLGKTHLKTLEIIADIAVLLSLAGKFGESAELFDEVLKREKDILGKEHPIYLETLTRRADSYHVQGKPDEAEKLLLEVLSRKRAMLADSNPGVQDALIQVAQCYQTQHRKRVINDLHSGWRRTRDDPADTNTEDTLSIKIA
jgi:tetratricopeptide (TPR) repeat protein